MEEVHILDFAGSLRNKWDISFVEQAIFGTTDPVDIARQVNTFCLTELGSSVAECLFYESSQGAVFGLHLANGQRVVLKAHQSSRSLDFLTAVYQVQQHLANVGYPCPRPLLGPKRLGQGTATVEELVDEGAYTDAHNPAIRRRMAEALAWLAEITQDLIDSPGLGPGMLNRLPPGALWPTPHSKIFNFEETAIGAEWIDALARKAREKLADGVGQIVLGHTDWSVKHFRFVDGKIRVIYDWDSLSREREPIIVGDAARGFTMTWHLDVPITPSPEEAQAFVHEYEMARGKMFSAAERALMAAAATYALAYGARCEHCLDPRERNFPSGSHREALARHGDAFLRPL
jgi:hypothetical protein